LPKLAAEDKTPVGVYSIKLRTDVFAQITGYGTYLNEQNPSTVGHVITEAFSTAIKGDVDWKAFWEKNAQKFQTAVVSSTSGKRGRRPKVQSRAA
jgi:hypothetical protein